MANLEKVAEAGTSARACTTLAELYLNSEKIKANERKAFDYYSKSADLGCVIGQYWTGVLLHRGAGCDKDLDKSIEYLEKASAVGNSQADYELFTIYANEPEKTDIPKAYNYLIDAMENGVTAFTNISQFFKDNIEVLKSAFFERKGLEPIEAKEEIINLHDAFVTEHLSKFSEAMKKDQLYERATAFMNDGMIWMLKTLKIYFIEKVLRFNHQDFLIALRDDIPPLFSYVGMWLMDNHLNRIKELGASKEEQKKVKTCIDIIKKVHEKGWSHEYFEKESKYHLVNKFSPKKCPDEHI